LISVKLDEVSGGDDHGETPATLTGTLTGVYEEGSGIVTMDVGTSSFLFKSLSQPDETLFTDVHTRWTTGQGSYSAAGYSCIEGTFDAPASFCGDYYFGFNQIDESSFDYSETPGSRTIGGDDIATGPLREGFLYYNASVASFDGLTLIMQTASWNDLGPGGTSTDGIQLVFTVVPIPATAWLFGSGLGLLGWMRRWST